VAQAEPQRVPQLVDELFRRRYGQLVAHLTRLYGTRHLGLIEDVASEAWLAALRTWPVGGVPDDPLAWLLQVARRRALDELRSQRLKAGERVDDEQPGREGLPASELSIEEIADDALRMIFTCCHPALAAETRVALTLKTLCGFDVAAIARAFLLEPTTVQQRLVRAKRRLEELDVRFEVPAAAELPRRLDAVLEVLYLMFNEGYSAQLDEAGGRAELVAESLRLCELLLSTPATRRPRVHALFALMLLQAARLAARGDGEGGLLTLAQQDRSKWDQAWMARGCAHFERALEGDELSSFHIEAAIAAAHAQARRYEDTDWRAILERYDALVALAPSPVALLARSVAVAKTRGVDAALREIEELAREGRLERYHLLHAVRGQLLWQRGELAAARAAFERALECCPHTAERRFLRARLERCVPGSPPDPL